MANKISIYRDDVWAGDGILLDDGVISDCAAELGEDHTESDATYEAIEDAIMDGDESVERPDGTYTWTISEEA